MPVGRKSMNNVRTETGNKAMNDRLLGYIIFRYGCIVLLEIYLKVLGEFFSFEGVVFHLS